MPGLLKSYLCPALCGFLCGSAWHLNGLARSPVINGQGPSLLFLIITTGLGFSLLALLCRWLIVVAAESIADQPMACTRWLRQDTLTYPVLLLPLAGGLGFRFDSTGLFVMGLLFLGAKVVVAWKNLPERISAEMVAHGVWLPAVFILSGFAALVYQVVWQRYLLVLLGVNIESVTLVVSLFMCGLGIGALLGGYASLKTADRSTLLALFLGCELLIGLIGALSSKWFFFLESSTAWTVDTLTVAALGYLLLPTILMGATLPLLVSYLKRCDLNPGEAVGWLYCGSTLGSAIACFATVHLLFLWFGLQACIIVAVVMNVAVAGLVFIKRRAGMPVSGEGVGHAG